MRDVIKKFRLIWSEIAIERVKQLRYNREVASGCSAVGSARGLGP